MSDMSVASRSFVKKLIPRKYRGALRQLAGAPPAKVKQFIPDGLGIDGFFAELNARGVRYVVLRWVDRLPFVRNGGDVDLIVHDEDGAAVADVLACGDGLVSCNPYSVSGLPGVAWHREIPCLPPKHAASVLDRAIMVKGLYKAPCAEHQFLSLAFHSVYHKGLNSGLPTSTRGLTPATPLNDYPGALRTAAAELGLAVPIQMEWLDSHLGECGWHPTAAMIETLVRRNAWMRAQPHWAAAAATRVVS